MHKIFVYGTLRPGTGETVLIPGQMFDLGWYPGVVGIGTDLEHNFTAEVIEVDDAGLKGLDGYEGFDPDHPDTSLYLRVEYHGGFIYQYNRSVEGKFPVLSGDWLDYTNMKEGSNAGLHSRR